MEISELVKRAHSAAVAKGWYERPRELPELLMLIVSELSEALESDRVGKRCHSELSGHDSQSFELYVKDTVEDEIADAVIRIADLCGHMGIDLDGHIAAKMRYNETRPHKHGKQY